MTRKYDTAIDRTSNRTFTGEDHSVPTRWLFNCFVLAFLLAMAGLGLACRIVASIPPLGLDVEPDWGTIALISLVISISATIWLYRWMTNIMWDDLRILQQTTERVRERASVADKPTGPAQPQLALTIQEGNTQYRWPDLNVDRDLFIEWGAAIVRGETLAVSRWNKVFGQRPDNAWIYKMEIIPYMLQHKYIRLKSATSTTHGHVPTKSGWEMFASLAEEGNATPLPHVIQDRYRELAPGEPTHTNTPGLGGLARHKGGGEYERATERH